MRHSAVALFLVSPAFALAGSVEEYVALAPNGDVSGGKSPFKWVKIDYPSGVSSADDVKFTPVTQPNDAIGSWYNVDPGKDAKPGVLQLSAKILGDNMYAMLDTGSAGPTGGGCCADTIRIYAKSGGQRDVPILNLSRSALNAPTAGPSHTFDVQMLNGKPTAFINVLYPEAELGNASCDAVVAVDMTTGTLVKTAAGAAAFKTWDAGTTSFNGKDSRFKVQFYKENTATGSAQQWHGNGVQRFTRKDGTALLAITHRADAEAVIFRDPFTYKDGGNIVQRFGTPYGWNSTKSSSNTYYRHFGLKATETDFISGVHNVWYRPHSEALGGAESVSLFVNSQVGADGVAHAQGYEFELIDATTRTDPGDDTVFDCKYVHAAGNFSAQAQGGARAIGNGVFLLAPGISGSYLEVADVNGKYHVSPYPTAIPSGRVAFPPSGGGGPALYDPFIRVCASGC